MLSREEKISRIVQTRLEGMDLSALEDFYVASRPSSLKKRLMTCLTPFLRRSVMIDWFDKFGWALVILAFIMLACQLMRYFIYI